MTDEEKRSGAIKNDINAYDCHPACFRRGGVLGATEPLSLKYCVAWFWEILSYGAVNCFALISGWGMGDKCFSYKRILKFCLTVYVITFAVWILRWDGNTNWEIVFKNSNPFNTYQWYVKSYIGVLILVPVLNSFLQNADKKAMLKFACASMLIFPFITLLANGDPFNLSQGYSVLWLSLLYLQGGIIKKLGLHEKVTTLIGIGGYAFFSLLAWGTKIGIEYLRMVDTGEYSENNLLITYISPFIILQSVFLFLAALRIDCKMPKFIYKLSGSIFGVYVIHMHYRVVGSFITNHYVGFVEHSTLKMCGLLALDILRIFAICLIMSLILTRIADLIWKWIMLIWDKEKRFLREKKIKP